MELAEMNVYQKLLYVQQHLNVQKTREVKDKWGKLKYTYRSCDDILEAIKAPCKEVGAMCVISDDVKFIEGASESVVNDNNGNSSRKSSGRFYVKASVSFIDVQTGESITSSAMAREPEGRAGMDDAQLTGSCSSYARKYALAGLLNLDDNKDPDQLDAEDSQNDAGKQPPQPKYRTPQQVSPVDLEDEILRAGYSIEDFEKVANSRGHNVSGGVYGWDANTRAWVKKNFDAICNAISGL